jgi:hypothetical protein
MAGQPTAVLGAALAVAMFGSLAAAAGGGSSTERDVAQAAGIATGAPGTDTAVGPMTVGAPVPVPVPPPVVPAPADPAAAVPPPPPGAPAPLPVAPVTVPPAMGDPVAAVAGPPPPPLDLGPLVSGVLDLLVPAQVGGGTFTYDPYADLGAWLDVYDWSATFTGGNPGAGVADIDRMAALGVRTLYIQASKWDSPSDVLEPERLRPIIDRAHALGMDVVGWYLPTLVDPGADLRRMLAIADFGVDGLAVDIEARNVGDVAERNRRLVELSRALRAALPDRVLSAIVLEPVLLENVNPNYWPGFPWAELAPLYDVWQPMAYWSNRRASSGYRDGYAYTAANIDRVRALIGQPDAVVHPIGGIGDDISAADVDGMVRAAGERRSIGGSIYDYRTTHDALWGPLLAFNG